MDKSGDLHEKNIDPRETGLSMKILCSEIRTALFGAVFIILEISFTISQGDQQGFTLK